MPDRRHAGRSGRINSTLKVLWITPQLPSLRGGAHVRQYHLLRRLCHKHEMTVVSLATPDELADASMLEALAVRTIIVPFDPVPPIGRWRRRLENWRQHLLDVRPRYAFTYPLAELQKAVAIAVEESRPDLAQLEHLFVAPCARTLGKLPWVLTAIDVESQKMQRANLLTHDRVERAMGRLEAAKLARWESAWVRRSTACVTMSEIDAAVLRRMAPATPVFVVPNGVDAAFFASSTAPDAARHNLLFLGNLGYSPNTDAVLYFTHEILPAVQTAIKDVRFRIIGPNAPPEIVRLGGLPGVDYIGFVSDVRDELWRAAVSVVPLRSGGGTRLKILESLAAGCSVVSTTVGAEGLDLDDGHEIVIADDTDVFAREVVRLLTDTTYRSKLAIAGKMEVTARYGWDSIAPKLDAVYASVSRL